jgi:anthranilate phosphoribosyltransferase
MTEDHPFAQYVRIVARGPNLSRPLTEAESLEAARMILADRVEPIQLGAFLCVLRVRTEVPEEGAGFVRAIRETLVLPKNMPAVDLDWSSYSGKKRQLPWYLLSALLLAQNGVRLFMHGSEGHTPGRVYAREVLETLGVPVAGSLDDAAAHIRACNFAYLPLGALCPKLQELIELKPVIGVRTPINTFVRLINPFAAPHVVQSIFHPNYGAVHRGIAELLQQPNMAVFKGEGGEVERRPQKPVVVQSLMDGKAVDEEWPPLMPDEHVKTDERMDLASLMAVWRGEEAHPYGEAAIIGTTAIALRLLGRAGGVTEAEALARQLWDSRAKDRLAAAA